MDPATPRHRRPPRDTASLRARLRGRQRETTWTIVAVTTVAALGLFAHAPRARACGGLFCSANQPVVQTAERIVFVQDGQTVTAVVEILYAGPAESFAWLLPVPGTPVIGVSSTAGLDALQGASNPQYILTTRTEGRCGEVGSSDISGGCGMSSDGRVGWEDGVGAGGAGGGAGGGSGAPPVTVLDRGQVGPYDHLTIALDPEAASPGDVAIEWLTEEGFDVSAFGGAILGEYLAEGLNLLAVRLSKDQDSGSVRPLVLTYASEHPMIPIRPTAVAADPNMGILVWTVGEARAVLFNYLTLELNEARIDWLNNGFNYRQVVTEAARDAGGQGFVTERAGPSSDYAEVVWPAWREQSFQALRGSTDPTAVVWELVQSFVDLDGVSEAVQAVLPESVLLEDMIDCPWCSFPDLAQVELEPLLDAIEAEAIAPMRALQALVTSQPYVTRFFTTMSPEDMTLDPTFDYNPQLGPVDNVHTAERVIACSSDVRPFEAPWHVELPSGLVVYGSDFNWPNWGAEGGPPALPPNQRLMQHAESGVGIVVADNTATIEAALAEQRDAVMPRGRSGCAVGRALPSPGFWLFAATALAFVRRRGRGARVS